MTLILMMLAAIGAVTIAERSLKHLLILIAAFAITVAILLLIVGDIERAILLSAILAAAIIGASTVKYNHSGFKLIAADLPLVFAGTVPFLLVQYPRVAKSFLAGSIGLLGAATVTLLYGAGSPISLEYRVLLLSLALVGFSLAYKISGGSASFRNIAAQPHCFFSSFMASVADTLSWQQFGKLALSDIAIEPLPLVAATPARTSDYPDIIIIQHESIFDPRIFGLPVEPIVEEFFSPINSVYGNLNVDIFGGGSWQSEFSLLTGLSSASFGSNAYFLFKKGAGRFHHSLPRALATLGYSTMLIASCRRNFLNYDEFYSSIGIGERIFTDDFPPPFDVREYETTNSDAVFLEAALAAFKDGVSGNSAPRFLYALTNFNHGPHARRLVPLGQFERERAFAAASLPDDQYAEYYARLAETATSWHRLRSELLTRLPKRPLLIVHYGDHQPVMTRLLEQKLNLTKNPQRQFRTFYVIESLNTCTDRPFAGRGADLDIAFLGTIALQQAGLPLDQIFATRASLLDDCGASYFASPSERKRRFHRTLIDMGMIG